MFLDKNIDAKTIVGALQKRHAKDIWFEELRLSSGFAMQGRIDFLAISPSPSTGNKAISYEVKVSRGDFKRDTAEKQRGARLYSDQFYYITPAGMLTTAEIPDWAGLFEVSWKALRIGSPVLSFNEVIVAPKRDKEPPSWGLVCSLIRNAKRHGGALG